MELDKLWGWQKKKLACRIRPENGNPAGDALREMFTELAGVDLNELLAEMKATKKKKEQANKVLIDYEGDKTFNEVLYRSRVLGASKLAMTEMEKYDEEKAATLTQKNIRKVFTVLPKSPPKRVLLEIQRERSKPLRLPDPEEQNAATAKLEKKLAKQRAARMAAIELATKNNDSISENSSKDAFIDGLLSNKAQTVLDPYYGDMFSSGGNYLGGMLYLSRMADASIKTAKVKSSIEEVSAKKSDVENLEEDLKNKSINAENDVNKKLANKDSSQTEVDFLAKFTCAVSLCNWSRNPANASRLASEGAVRAIIQLSLEPSEKIISFCAAAFRYMSEQHELALSLIEDGAIASMSELATSKTDDFILYNCAFALVNLTKLNGKEAQLVGEAAIVLAIMNLIGQKNDLGVICVRGLYNLTCVDSSYQFIERVIRALVSLSMSAGANVKHLCAAALCNLSDLKSVRPRMVEEGAINVLTALSRGAETRTRRVCAVILQNLSAAKSIRVEMASRNSVTAAYSLSSDQDPIILRCIGLTLSRLSMEPSNIQRIITESGIAALCNIAVKYPTIPGISQPVASAFQLLSSHQPYRLSIVTEGCVTAIAALLLSSQDMFTLQHSLLALCNLLCEAENHIAIIHQGLIITLITMCDQDNELIKDFCSLAFLNLSCSPDSRKHIVSSGAIVAIIAVARQSSEITKRRCAATLCNISYFTPGMSRMVSDGIIPSVVSLVLAKDILTIHYSCAALCHLCCTVDNARLILDSGAVDNLVQGAMEGDNVTKEFCGSVLSSLSYYQASRVELCKLGAIAALKGLADFNNDVTKQRCLVAFANLSGEQVIQRQMVEEGVVSIISELANSNQEINYICCAKAICNLACCEETKLTVAKDGGVHALLMISMVKSVDKNTKFLCVLGLNNLLNETTLNFMLDEGLVGSIANLSKIGDNSISNLCAIIFNHLSKYEDARIKMIERVPNITALIKLSETNETMTQLIAIRTCCNLILDGYVRQEVIKNGGYSCLEKGIKSKDGPTIVQCLTTLLSVCNDQIFMESLSKTNIPSLLLDYILRDQTSSEEFTLIIQTICMLSSCKRSRFFLQKIEFVQQFINLIHSPNIKVLTLEWIAATAKFLVLGYNNISELLDIGIPHALSTLNGSNIGDDTTAKNIASSLVAALRILVTQCPSDSVHQLAWAESISILSKGVKLCSDDKATLYDAAVVMYTFATNGPVSRMKISSPDSAFVLNSLKNAQSVYYILIHNYNKLLVTNFVVYRFGCCCSRIIFY